MKATRFLRALPILAVLGTAIAVALPIPFDNFANSGGES